MIIAIPLCGNKKAAGVWKSAACKLCFSVGDDWNTTHAGKNFAYGKKIYSIFYREYTLYF